jgi:hypothetical protein
MAAPDKTWSDLLLRLKDNNEGSITEEDVRSLARFAQTSYATASSCAAAVPSGAWVGTVPSDFVTLDPTVTMPRYYRLLSTATSPTSSVYRHSGGDYLSVDTLAFTYGGGTGGDVAAATRLVMFSWDTELYFETLEHCAIGWYYQPVASTWPTGAKRHRIGRMYSQLGWQDNTSSEATDLTNVFTVDGASSGYSVTSTGTGSIVMNPGDKLIPLLEHYGPSGSLSVPMINFDLTAYTAGVVDAWTPPDQYWGNVSYAESEAPFEYPTIPRLLGAPTT